MLLNFAHSVPVQFRFFFCIFDSSFIVLSFGSYLGLHPNVIKKLFLAGTLVILFAFKSLIHLEC